MTVKTLLINKTARTDPGCVNRSSIDDQTTFLECWNILGLFLPLFQLDCPHSGCSVSIHLSPSTPAYRDASFTKKFPQACLQSCNKIILKRISPHKNFRNPVLNKCFIKPIISPGLNLKFSIYCLFTVFKVILTRVGFLSSIFYHIDLAIINPHLSN